MAHGPLVKIVSRVLKLNGNELYSKIMNDCWWTKSYKSFFIRNVSSNFVDSCTMTVTQLRAFGVLPIVIYAFTNDTIGNIFTNGNQKTLIFFRLSLILQ